MMLKCKGFTLSELVVVLVLLSVLSVMFMALTPGRQVDLTVQATQLATAIRYTQQLAGARWQRYRINFSNTHYQLTERDGTTAIFDPGGFDSQTDLATGVTLSATHNFIVFDSLGVPYASANLGDAPLDSAVVITLTAGNDSRQITVSPETGCVSVNE